MEEEFILVPKSKIMYLQKELARYQEMIKTISNELKMKK